MTFGARTLFPRAPAQLAGGAPERLRRAPADRALELGQPLLELADPLLVARRLLGERPLLAHAGGVELGDDLALELPDVVPQRGDLARVVGQPLDLVGIQLDVAAAQHRPAVVLELRHDPHDLERPTPVLA